jgi:hypothetical protein
MVGDSRPARRRRSSGGGAPKPFMLHALPCYDFTMSFSIRRLLVAAVAVLALLVAVAVAATAVVDVLGLRVAEPDRAALTELARSGRPIIAALERYRQEHGAPPQAAADLAGLMPEGVAADDVGAFIRFDVGSPPGWLYSPAIEGNGYELTRMAGEDPKLIWSDQDGKGHWLYDAGDGADPVPVTLD